ncbi:YchJ family protein [Dietzia alimentaria]|uniref:YchJ family protein n=1 Tax=Dietzia alimentaria TaxID=665550 RepID=UPI0030834E5F
MRSSTGAGIAPLASRGVQCSLGTHCEPHPRQAKRGSSRRSTGVLFHLHRSRQDRTRSGLLSGSGSRRANARRGLQLDMSVSRLVRPVNSSSVSWAESPRGRNSQMTECPCGGGENLGACCGPLVEDGMPAETAVQLMRSRYRAFALGREDHLWRTWHPRTRPPAVEVGGVEWTGLTVVDVVAGGRTDEHGEVEFEVRFAGSDGPEVLRERSRFERRGGRWTYLEGGDPAVKPTNP